MENRRSADGLRVFRLFDPRSEVEVSSQKGSMMLNPTGRRSLDPRSRPKVESLEGRQLLATDATIAPPLPIVPPPLIVPPVAPSGAPQVSYVQFEPLTGKIQVTFSGDLAGYNTAQLTDPANYSLTPIETRAILPTHDPSRPKAGVVLAPEFKITGATLSTPAAPDMPESIIVSVDNNQPLRPGSYRFTIHSAGITDLAGRALDGEYFGTFPSGDGRPGGEFVAILAQVKNTVLPALPTTNQSSPLFPPGGRPTYVFLPSTREVRVRVGKSVPGKFLLANGNNITLAVVPGQHFPGTFRLPPNTSTLTHAKGIPHLKSI